MWKYIKAIFDGSLDSDPARLTLIQSVIVTLLAAVMSASLYMTVGIHFPGVWYQIFAALFIAAILAPIFLYPSYRTAHRLRTANTLIRRQAFTDHLTELPNSFALTAHLEERFRVLERAEGFAIHFVDVDRFKQINDSLGHEAGNAVLKAIAGSLLRQVGEGDFVARFGSDQFAIIQSDVSTAPGAADYAMKIRDWLSTTYEVAGNQVGVEVTVGTALAPLHGDAAGHMLKAADLALYRAKGRGTRNELFTPQMAMAASRRRVLEVGLTNALPNGQLSLVFQPILKRKAPQRIVALEALMRWQLPDGTMVYPSEFIPVAEHTGSIVEIGEWALREACLACKEWPGDVRVAINVSPVQFFRSNVLATVKNVLAETGLPPHRVELEITESVLIGDTTLIEPILNELRQMGVRIALDDFGSGYCGLNYLRQFTIDKIKVDKSITDDVCTSEKAMNILRGVSRIASEIGMTVTVEGVDTAEKANLLDQEDCADEVQGFIYSQPVALELVPRMIASS